MDNYGIFWVAILIAFTIYSFSTSLNSKDNNHIILGWGGYLFSLFSWSYILIEPNTPIPINVGITLGDWGAKEYTHLLLFGTTCYVTLGLPLILRVVKENIFKLMIKKGLI